MEGFAQLLSGMPEFKQIHAALEQRNTPLLVTGLSACHKAHLILSLDSLLEKSGLIVTPDEASAVRLCEDLNIMAGDEIAAVYPYRELCLREVESASREYEHARLAVLGRMSEGTLRFAVASASAALQYTLPPEKLRARSMVLHAGKAYEMTALVHFLSAAGYVRADQVEGVGQFSQRGGILDFYPPHMPDPFRVEFWGDEIDTISTFKTATQRRVDTVKEVRVVPAAEAAPDSLTQMAALLRDAAAGLRGTQGKLAKELLAKELDRLESGLSLECMDRYMPLLYPEAANLFSYLPEEGVFYLSDPGNCREVLRAMGTQQAEDLKILFSEGILFKGCDQFSGDFTDLCREASAHNSLLLDTFVRSVGDIPLKAMLAVNAVQLSSWSGELGTLLDEVQNYLERDYCVILFAGTQRAAYSLAEDLQRNKVRVFAGDAPPVYTPGAVFIIGRSMSAGMEYPDYRLAVISQAKTVSQSSKKRPRPKNSKKLQDISDLTPGDYVVHAAHGIGVFQGIVKREIQGITKDYIQIKYAGTDMLFVPVTQLDLVSKYVGVREDASVRLSKLNSAEWQKTRARVKKAVAEMAKELIELYARRSHAKGHAFAPDNDWQNDFERRFPYDETDDQLRSIEEIKRDMEQPTPMDRLLCGDVGFGKTEVALRAAFKCVMDGKQVALLCPTTILAWQHFQTVKRRMEGFPVKIDLLSRFRTPKEQKQVLDELRRGETDLIIGTHRLVQADVQFKDLGLCIVDEEQRFGVKHKERFKEMRAEVDMLNLSATPIPRTLNMAMSGIRDMSVLEEAPQDRRPVQTYVVEHNWGLLAQAIERELRRDGQVFYLHNRVETIDQCAGQLLGLLPEGTRITCAHGKMTEEQLSRVWRQLLDHEIDVLVCTTIIETGIDIPNCNTLIIEDADRMGLAQLYQIRGRVGRSSRRAYAYLTFRPNKELTEIASKRLTAIREFTSFGSGFRIAMRDLEIRGAGNILGAQQHGHMESVGYDMYLKLLGEAIAEQKGEQVSRSADACMVDIRVGAHIPESYIDSLAQRIDIYKKIAAIQNDEDAMDLVDELIDRFGEPPEVVKGLVDVALVRNTASAMGISEISQRDNAVLLFPEVMDMARAGNLAVKLRGRVMVSGGAKPYITVKLARGQDPITAIREALDAMAG